MDTPPLPFSLRQIQYALALAETRNFHRAAERCAVAQPSLSAQIAALEGALGLRLFERSRGGVLPTPAGEALLPRFAELVRSAEDTARNARAFLDPLAGPLRLGIIPTMAPYLLPAAAPALRRAFPRLQALWTEGRTPDLVRAVREGRLEGALLALEADLGDLETTDLFRDPFRLCLPKGHPLAKGRAPVPLAALAGEFLLLLDDGHCLRDQALAACASSRVEEAGFRATSLPTLVQMVAGGAGVTLLPQLAVSTEAARADVVIRPLAKPEPFRTLGLVWRKGSFAAQAMREVAAALRGLPLQPKDRD
jgi:LysR family hydrogen peroxide-inducible transcriptional activator